MENLQVEINKYIAPFKAGVKRKAKGVLKHDYLVPGGVYEEQWDWDAFFMGMALASEDPTEAIFLRNWALNYIENSQENGFIPGCVTPNGMDPRLKQMKPLLAQGSYFASNFLNDFDWLKNDDIYERLKKVVLYREEFGFFDKKRNLGSWTNSMESGADNDVASLDFPDGGVFSVDFNCYLYREYLSMSKIAEKLQNFTDADLFMNKSKQLKESILLNFWCEEEGAFYSINRANSEFIKVVSYSCVHPFWAGIATQEQAEKFFNHYLLNEDKMLSPYGIRTLSKTDDSYNNVNMIKPYSNWQGPIWPIANYIYVTCLVNYGYWRQAEDVISKVIRICIDDIKKTGGMHENYDAETGEPLAAPNFISWNLLLINVLKQIEELQNPFKLL